ncbi:MAG: hypothetical protein HRT36_05160 [Alphaproteobacteria bacterium]|nr:hypothetical protein [Alphaproteobacteria bacterium]
MTNRDETISYSRDALAACVDAERLASWLTRAQSSRYLRKLLQRDVQAFKAALRDPEAAIASLLCPDPAWQHEPSSTVARILRRRKRELALLLATLDYGQIMHPAPDLMTLTGYLSDFAALAVEAGLSCLMREQGFVDHQGVVVLGMGKLGGRELNYSSDIDLIVLYDRTRLTREADAGNNYRRVQRVMRHLVVFLESPDAEGYIFRSDFRLRPDPSSMPLAVEVEAAVYYYESMGLAWERAAMLKARAIAGDFALAEIFFNRIKPFIWRRNLDYASIDDIYVIRARTLQSHHAAGVDGVNVKLVEGGIREIELFVQSLQLIWGGRIPSLQIKPTLEALQALAAAEIIGAAIPGQLGAAYRYYRCLEHTAQLLDDQQCHALPKTSAEWQDFTSLLAEDTASIRTKFLRHLETVRSICQPQSLTIEQSTPHSLEDIAWFEQLGYRDPAGVQAITERWLGGGYRVTATERARRLLVRLLPELLRAFAATTTPDDALQRMDQFLEALPAGVQLFSLFAATPELLRHCADIMGNAPRMARWLSRKPSLFEYLLQTSNEPLPVLPIAVQGLEETLDQCRRLAHEVEFCTSVGFMAGKVTLEELFQQHSQTAEVIIGQTLRALRAGSPKLPKQGFAILALGKLGRRRLMPDSDLDLLFLSQPAADVGNVPYVRLAQRLLSGLSVATAEGHLYEVDLRLRPHGNAGALCSQFSAVQKYYAEEAWLWEHYALSQTRVLYADSDLEPGIQDWLHELQTRNHDPSALRRAVLEMRPKITEAFPPQGMWDVKHSYGGLMDAGFCTQYLQICLSPEQPDLIEASDGVILEAGAAAGFLPEADCADVDAAIQLMMRLQAGVRVSGGSKTMRLEYAPPGQRRLLSRLAGSKDFRALEDRLRGSYRTVAQLYDHLFLT